VKQPLRSATAPAPRAGWGPEALAGWRSCAAGPLLLAVDAAGTVFLGWKKHNDVLLSASYDRGVHWQTRRVATNGQFPTLAVLGTDRIGIAWMQS
jgi:hypothetical protein